MSRTQITGQQVQNSSVQRDDLDSVTVGQSVIKKLIPGSGINFVSTGADVGTGDVTISIAPVGDISSKADTTYVDSQDLALAQSIATKTDVANYSISTINAATRLIQTQVIMAKLVSIGIVQ